MGFYCKLYVDDDEIYAGDFSEVPKDTRLKIIDDLSEWADCLSKGGLNELLYSHLSWYDDRSKYCESCAVYSDETEWECVVCGSLVVERFIHERNTKLDKILMCVGMISRIEIDQ